MLNTPAKFTRLELVIIIAALVVLVFSNRPPESGNASIRADTETGGECSDPDHRQAQPQSRPADDVITSESAFDRRRSASDNPTTGIDPPAAAEDPSESPWSMRGSAIPSSTRTSCTGRSRSVGSGTGRPSSGARSARSRRRTAPPASGTSTTARRRDHLRAARPDPGPRRTDRQVRRPTFPAVACTHRASPPSGVAPTRVTPRARTSRSLSRSRTPPAALTCTFFGECCRISLRSSMVAPPVP